MVSEGYAECKGEREDHLLGEKSTSDFWSIWGFSECLQQLIQLVHMRVSPKSH